MKFITVGKEVKHSKITTIFRDNYTEKYLQKLSKMPSWKAWVQRPVGLIKIGETYKHFRRQ
jgi:hypothetical protein